MVQNPLKPISYTNKDFNTIFVELLDIVKELSSKWDPSISNESDPGVILLKADAIIADKNNYNIDKNTLENFPETATQELNVRNLYNQLAYKMPWYRSASCNVYFRYLGKDDSALQQGQQLLIPKYTMITDADNSVVYTTIEDAVIPSDTLNTTVKALQGILNIHEVHGTSNIQLSDIDYNNRLYLNDYQVAQNGVFIENTENGNQWTQVDNLAVEPNGNYYFEFGVDARNSVCYIEFPEDVSKLIKSGITIRYIVSEGAQGNIAAKLLDRFYNDTSGTIATKQVPLNNDNIQLYNVDGTHDGYDPESIQQAFKSYKRVAGTFNTLVTLRDYIDAIYNSGYASNDVVTDRLTDIQTAYKTVTENKVNKYYTYITEEKVEYKFDKVHKDPGYSIQASDNLYTYTTNSSGHISSTTYVSSGTVSPGTDYLQLVDDSKAYMDAFDLKLYVLHNPGIIKTVADYESSFDVEYSDSEIIERIKNYINEEQTILHDFKNILPDVPFMFFNEYPVGIKIVPQQKLSDLEIYQVKSNIVAALMEECNAHSCEFGVEPDYNLIYDTILNSDERIKLVVLDDFDYTTFACYYDAVEGIFKKIPISDSNSSFIIHIKSSDDVQKLYDMNVYDKVKLKNCYILADDNINITETITLTNGQYILNYKCVDQSSIVVTNSTGTVQRIGGEDYSYDSTDNAIIDLGNDLQDGDKVTYRVYVKGYIYVYNGEELEVYSTILKDVRLNIICKSILAGRTPLYDTYSDFIYTIIQQNTHSLNISHITSGVGIYPFSNSSSYNTDKTITFPDGNSIVVLEPDDDNPNSNGTYKLSSNEMIRIYETSYKANTTYSNYIKYQFYRNEGSQEVIPANSNYKLTQNDRLAFFWRDINEKDAPWNYRVYKGNNIDSFIDNNGNINNPVLISPNFTLHSITSEQYLLGEEYGEKGIINYGDSLYEDILDLTTDLGATNIIDIIEPIQTKLNMDKNYIYVITNNISDNKYHMQFEKILDNTNNQGFLYRYTLQQDEYFIYTNKDKSEFEVLGTGTMIGIYSYTDLNNPEISNNMVKFEKIAVDGISAIDDFQSFNYNNLFVREQKVTTLSEGDTIEVYLKNGVSNVVNFYSWEDTSLDTVQKIVYTDNGNNATSMDIDDITYYNTYARAYLNINCSNTNIQQIYGGIIQNSVLKSFQFVAYPTDSGWERFPDTSLSSNSNYMQAYNPIQALGGFNIDISYIDLYSNSINNRIYLYTNDTSSDISIIENNLLLISYDDTPDDKHLQLPEGSYIMKVENKDLKFTFTITYSDEDREATTIPLTPINSNTYSLGRGIYYYKIPYNGYLTFVLNNSSMNPLTVYPLVKITDIEKFYEKYDISFDNITNRVKELDYNNKFKYDYIIPEDDLIEDPLKTISLFNEKHILNQFTIPYARVNLSSDITDSYITIINNR